MKLTHTLAVMAFAAAVSQAAISYTPVTEGATGGAQKLYNFLATNYGVKTISGMMTGDVGTSLTDVRAQVDVDSMYLKTGKYPALVGFDFLFATGKASADSWGQAYTNSALTLAKDLWNRGGIPAFTWHWKDPSDSVNAFYVSGHDTCTTFDFTKGFTSGTTTWDTTSTTYKQLVSDIDTIAAKFLILQKDSVAAIFRPLHEASGAWFWWGTKGGPAFKALYNLVYDRMVNVNGVKNLVWDWNPEYGTDTAWNPGADKYDVISMDIYEAWDYTKKFSAGYNALKTSFGSDKIFASSENGPIPDASTMHGNGTVWSWWMPWYQSWNGKFLDQTMDAVWKANMADSTVITLDEMPGWDKYTISTSQVTAATVGYKLGDLDTARNTTVIYPGDTASNGWLMAKLSAGSDDTAKGNIVIATASSSTGTVADLSSAKTLTMNVYNTNAYSGIWFTVAFLGNENKSWGWAQPDGCWINAGDSTTCKIDLTTLTQDKKVLTGTDYSSFMKNIFKVYIEVFAAGFSGNVFYDNVTVDGSTVINSFDKSTSVDTIEQAQNLTFAIVGNGNKANAISPAAGISASHIVMQGDNLLLTLAQAGNVTVDLFDLQGHRAASLYSGSLSAGTHALSLKNVSKGLYVVRAKGATVNAMQKVIVK